MKKIIYGIGILLVCIACILPFTRADDKVAFAIMQKEVDTIVTKYEKDFVQKDKKFIRKVYELNDNDYTNMLCYSAPQAMEVNELCIAHYNNDIQKKKLISQLQKRIDRQYKSFSGYAPRQAELLKKAIVLEKRDYIITIVHKDGETIKEAISALF